MTNAPANRKTHVIRILGTNKNGDVLSDIWADVERIDEAKSVYQHDITNWQGTVRKLKWLDDPDGQDYEPDGPPSRKTRIVKVCSPDEPDQSDPEQWIPIPVIDKMRSSISDQGNVRSHINAERSNARIVQNRRILHYDTSIDDEAQAAFDADPSRKVYVVPGDRYSRDQTTKDDSQWVEHEIIAYLKNRDSNQTKTGQGDDQGKQTKLLNQYLIDESEQATLEVTGSNGINPPWRLDPYQNIINVKFTTTNNLMFIWHSGAPSEPFEFDQSGFYVGLVGDVGSGSFDDSLFRPHGFTRGSSSGNPTAAQNETAAALGGETGIDGSLLFVYADPIIYVINPNGDVIQSVDRTAFTDISPPDFDPDGNPSEPPPDFSKPAPAEFSFAVASNVGYLAFEIDGVTPPGPATIVGGPHDGEPANIYAHISAVGYLGVGKDGVVASAIISGPHLGVGFTDVDNTEYKFQEAHLPSLYLVSKKNDNPT